MRGFVSEFLILAGIVGISFGAFMIYAPAGVLALGAQALALGCYILPKGTKGG